MDDTILVTGASGFLGSALCADLAVSHNVVGLYRRQPSEKLKNTAPNILWIKGDVADADCIHCAFKKSASRGRPITYVIHFAAFTGFGEKWEDDYNDTNVIGTRNIIEASCDAGVKRILFAGSIAALEPPDPGQVLTERTIARGSVAYARSKAMGEKLFYENSLRMPAVVLRLGGVFTDWCELPPLFSVIKMWSQPFWGRMMPGQGLSGFPYIHRRDVVDVVRRIIEKNEALNRFETLFGSPPGATCQKDLFPIIRRAAGPNFSSLPIHVSLPFAKLALHGKYLFNLLRMKKTYERAWMIDYVDRPLVVDTRYTKDTLGWSPDPCLHILDRLPLLMDNFNAHTLGWLNRNINRNDQRYAFDPD